jgi:hypothetical protein
MSVMAGSVLSSETHLPVRRLSSSTLLLANPTDLRNIPQIFLDAETYPLNIANESATPPETHLLLALPTLIYPHPHHGRSRRRRQGHAARLGLRGGTLTYVLGTYTPSGVWGPWPSPSQTLLPARGGGGGSGGSTCSPRRLIDLFFSCPTPPFKHLHASCPLTDLRHVSFSEPTADVVLHYQIIDLGQQVLVWVAANSAAFSNLTLAVQTQHVSWGMGSRY